MRRVVLTGAPGSGKTAILHGLRDRGYFVVPEAATDIIATEQQRGVDEPWMASSFIDMIVDLQLQRLAAEAAWDGIHVHDRSPFCTLALAEYAGRAPSRRLLDAVALVSESATYDQTVLLVRPLGFIERTAARRISYENSLAFERIHEDVYRRHGFRLIDVPPLPITARTDLVESMLA